uniref:Peptidase M12B domain-containing protein n=1 Tax=Hippocampus comes TaxID=109280 RepID=A0A3Q2YJA0_HIPCM
DLEKVKQRLAEIANYVDKFYRALNIRVALVGLEVWSDADKCPVTQDPFTTLHEFLDWRKVKLLPRKPHDNTQLIRWDSPLPVPSGKKKGIDYLRIFTICGRSRGDHSDNPLGAAVTLAHELGHNFGMNHDTPERGCGLKCQRLSLAHPQQHHSEPQHVHFWKVSSVLRPMHAVDV